MAKSDYEPYKYLYSISLYNTDFVILRPVFYVISIPEITPVSTTVCRNYPCEHYCFLWELPLWALLFFVEITPVNTSNVFGNYPCEHYCLWELPCEHYCLWELPLWALPFVGITLVSTTLMFHDSLWHHNGYWYCRCIHCDRTMSNDVAISVHIMPSQCTMAFQKSSFIMYYYAQL